MIKLIKVIYDLRARDGTWCRLPYPGHPKGCPNFPQCPTRYEDFSTFQNKYSWYAVIEEFNLKIHAAGMKWLHPHWTERQCRNLLYWQGGVKLRLRGKAYASSSPGDLILEIPEGYGVDVFKTMALVGIKIERRPDIVKKIMLIGKFQN